MRTFVFRLKFETEVPQKTSAQIVIEDSDVHHYLSRRCAINDFSRDISLLFPAYTASAKR